MSKKPLTYRPISALPIRRPIKVVSPESSSESEDPVPVYIVVDINNNKTYGPFLDGENARAWGEKHIPGWHQVNILISPDTEPQYECESCGQNSYNEGYCNCGY